MITAILFAGGNGRRMGQLIPKQFINVYDKPVIIYTLEDFQRHSRIDAIEVICIDSWHDILRSYSECLGITQKWIISDDETGKKPNRNEFFYLLSPNDMVLFKVQQKIGFVKNTTERGHFFLLLMCSLWDSPKEGQL